MALFQRVLAIETSCDDTSVAVVEADGRVLACVSADQNRAHEAFGGVVPEIASRNHTLLLLPLVDRVLQEARLRPEQIDGIAVTSRPGLIGSLLVGVVSAKALALAWDRPFIGVNHLEGHLLAPFLRDAQHAPPLEFAYPFVALAISGGHTSLYVVHQLADYEEIGHSIDDAAGEAFDKFAKLIGLGFPGGVRVDRIAAGGNRDRFKFPRSLLHDEGFQFSFSGLKTAALRTFEALPDLEQQEIRRHCGEWVADPSHSLPTIVADLCASYQEAIVDVLLARLEKACVQKGMRRAVITGGVSANSRLRARSLAWAQSKGVQIVIPPLRYCTDNAAMIGYAGIQRLNRGEVSPQDLGPEPRAPLGRQGS